MNYKSNIARTLLINPDKGQQKNYLILYKLQKLLISSFIPGTKISDVYKKGVEFVKS